MLPLIASPPPTKAQSWTEPTALPGCRATGLVRNSHWPTSYDEPTPNVTWPSGALGEVYLTNRQSFATRWLAIRWTVVGKKHVVNVAVTSWFNVNTSPMNRQLAATMVRSPPPDVSRFIPWNPQLSRISVPSSRTPRPWTGSIVFSMVSVRLPLTVSVFPLNHAPVPSSIRSSKYSVPATLVALTSTSTWRSSTMFSPASQ